MKLAEYITHCDAYEICRRFRICLVPLSDYLVKRVGVDYEFKRPPARISLGKRAYPRFSRSIYRLFHSLRSRKRKHTHLKIEYYEHA